MYVLIEIVNTFRIIRTVCRYIMSCKKGAESWEFIFRSRNVYDFASCRACENCEQSKKKKKRKRPKSLKHLSLDF